MTILEVIGIILTTGIVATICIVAIYGTIMDIVEKYSIRKEERAMKEWKEVFNQAEKLFNAILEKAKEKERERDEKINESWREMLKTEKDE